MSKLNDRKRISKQPANDSFASKFSFDSIIPVKYQPLTGILVLVVLFVLFFSPLLFQGKTFQSGDILTSESYKTFRDTFQGQSLWNPYIFCGMPSQVSGVGYSHWFDFLNTGYADLRIFIGNIFNNDYAQHTIFILVLAITSFFFMRSKKVNTWVAVITGFAAAFSTGIIVFVFIGHITKLYTVSVFPLIFMMLERLREKIKLLDFVILTIACSIAVSGWHIQVIFYTLFAILIYYIFFFLSNIKNKNVLLQLVKSGALFIAAFLIAMSLCSDMFLQLFEYTKYSTRGTKGIIENTKTAEGPKSESDFYSYNTMWSFSPGEVMTFIIPSYYGFGNNVYKGELSNGKEVEANTYFGQMEYVDVAMYMGVIVFFFGIFGIYANRKDKFIQYLGLLIIISLLISFGKNFPILFNLMYYHFPYFDKFRVPSMVLVLIQLTMPILAGYGIWSIIKAKDNSDVSIKNAVKYLAYVFTGIFVLCVLLTSPIKDSFVQRINESPRKDLAQIGDFLSDQFAADVYLAFGLTAAAFWLAHLYLKNKLSKDLFAAAVLILIVFDLFRVTGKGAKFIDVSENSNKFVEPDYITAIKKTNDKDVYRLVNFKQGAMGSVGNNSNYNLYFLQQDFAGYSGIKPRAYQDYIDVVGYGSPTMWRMLNIKYIVADGMIGLPGMNVIYADTVNKTIVYQNTNALPRAYLVDSVAKGTGMEILNAVKDNKFDPKKLSYVEDNVTVVKPDTSAYSKILRYENDKIEIEVNATGNNFLFLGDTYYPKGWKAAVDGDEVEIHKANWGFRGIVVPAGKHIVDFTYSPKSYTIGKDLSLTGNILILIGLAAGIYLEIKNKKKTNADKAVS
jgi:hypothetical protein